MSLEDRLGEIVPARRIGDHKGRPAYATSCCTDTDIQDRLGEIVLARRIGDHKGRPAYATTCGAGQTLDDRLGQIVLARRIGDHNGRPAFATVPDCVESGSGSGSGSGDSGSGSGSDGIPCAHETCADLNDPVLRVPPLPSCIGVPYLTAVLTGVAPQVLCSGQEYRLFFDSAIFNCNDTSLDIDGDSTLCGPAGVSGSVWSFTTIYDGVECPAIDPGCDPHTLWLGCCENMLGTSYPCTYARHCWFDPAPFVECETVRATIHSCNPFHATATGTGWALDITE